MLAKRASRDIKCHYLNGSRNRDISFFSSPSFAGSIRLLLGAGLSASDMVSAITPSLSTCPSRREAPSEVGNVVDFVAILFKGREWTRLRNPRIIYIKKCNTDFPACQCIWPAASCSCRGPRLPGRGAAPTCWSCNSKASSHSLKIQHYEENYVTLQNKSLLDTARQEASGEQISTRIIDKKAILRQVMEVITVTRLERCSCAWSSFVPTGFACTGMMSFLLALRCSTGEHSNFTETF